jgi:hypothetical protein
MAEEGMDPITKQMMLREAPKFRDALREFDSLLAEQTSKFDEAVREGDDDAIAREGQMLVILGLVAFMSLSKSVHQIKDMHDLGKEMRADL